MKTTALITSPSSSAEPYPHHPGIQDVLDSAPPEVHALILLLAAMVKELGVESTAEVLREAPPWPADDPGLFGETPGEIRHPFDPYEDVLRSSNQFPARPYRVPPFNVIPASRHIPAMCLPTVVALAHGTKAPRGLAMTLRLLREHLIRCGSGPKGLMSRTAIVVTDAWSPRAAYESARDLAAHSDMTNLKVVTMHWDGMRWRPRVF